MARSYSAKVTEVIQAACSDASVTLCDTAAVTQEHVQELLILQHDGSFHQVLKVGVDAGADPSVLGHPLLRLDVDVVPHLRRGGGVRRRESGGQWRTE